MADIEISPDEAADRPALIKEAIRRLGTFAEASLTPLLVYCVTTALVVAGTLFSGTYIRTLGLPHSLSAWDGGVYAEIAQEGYRVPGSGAPSTLAFFPAYPLAGRAVSPVLNVHPETALLIVSHAAFLLALVVLALYLAERPDAIGGRREVLRRDTRGLAWAEAHVTEGRRPREIAWTLLMIGLWPTTFFFRMAYSDSLFLLLIVLAMWLMQRNANTAAVALVTGAATAARPVGVALVPVFLLWLWQRAAAGRSRVGGEGDGNGFRMWNGLWLVPLSVWGLAAYVAYQQSVFGEGLAFLNAQSEWTQRPGAPLGRELAALATLEPIWSVYVPTSYAWWGNWDPQRNPLFSLQFANPIYFMIAAALVAAGAWKRWLTSREVLLSVLLLGIPYATHSYRAVMMGHGRYAAIVFPAFIVLGRLLAGAPRAVGPGVSMVCGFLLAAYAALFVAWRPLI